NVACERAVEQDVFDRALFVIVAVNRLDQRLRCVQSGSDRSGKLPAQRQPTLFGYETRLGIARIADDLLEARSVELAVGSAECGIVGDEFGDLGIGERKPERACAFIEQDFGEDLPDCRAVETGRARLIRADRTAELA